MYISDLQFSIGTGAVKAKMYVQIVQPIFGGFMFSLSLSEVWKTIYFMYSIC